MLVMSFIRGEKRTSNVSQLLLSSMASDGLITLVCSNAINKVESLANVGLAIAHVVRNENEGFVV